ncbi:MAG: DUF885 domain-containing protein [Lachnospiraceae bacterium]|nr:DUF885 domain-containing protein [Lachnospiraceae bacterium]
MIRKRCLSAAVSTAAALSLMISSVPVCAEESASAAFDALADEFYWSLLELVPTNLHFCESDQEDLPFEMTEPLGSFSESMEEEKELIRTISDKLNAIAYEELDSHQKQVYRNMQYFLDLETASLDLPDYYATLGPMNGLLTNTDTIISEYYIRNETDIENYMVLLNDIPRFLDDVILELNYQESIGFAPSAYVYECALESREDMTELEEHPYLVSFLSNLEEASLSEDVASSYTQQVRSILSDTVLPAYESFYDTLEEKSQTAGESRGLCSYDQGTEYYAALIEMNTGCDMTPDEMYNYLQTKMAKDIGYMSRILFMNPSAIDQMESIEVPSNDPAEVLELLKEKVLEEFPAIDHSEFTISYLPESLEVENLLAYYITPPNDLPSRNIIRVNRGTVGDDPATLWTTLAHEGFPGHLYQTQYVNQYLSPYPIESFLSSLGTTEGWASYVQGLSLEWAGVDEDVADLYWYNNTINMALSGIVDIGVNYKGWSVEDIGTFLGNYLEGIDEETCQDLFDTVASDPGAYLPYAVGYYQMADLFDSIRPNYASDRDMYTAFLNYSNLPFVLLKQYLGSDGSI